jgi:hypothetical protein
VTKNPTAVSPRAPDWRVAIDNRSHIIAAERERTMTKAPPGERLEDLGSAEHLLIWSMRTIALGYDDCPIVGRTFRRVCGDACATQALQTHAIFVKYLAMAARRPLQVQLPGCSLLAPGEAAVLAILAAAQRSDEAEVRLALRELTGAPPDGGLILVAQELARLLRAAGHLLSERRDETLRRAHEPGPPRLGGARERVSSH